MKSCGLPNRLGMAIAMFLAIACQEQRYNDSPTVSVESVKRYDRPNAPIIYGAEVNSKLFFSSGLVADALDETTEPNAEGRYGNTYQQSVSTPKKIEKVLKNAGLELGDVVKMNVYLAPDPAFDGEIDFQAFFKAYGEFFNNDKNPTKVARTTLGVAKLARPNLQVEIEVVAAFPKEASVISY